MVKLVDDATLSENTRNWLAPEPPTAVTAASPDANRFVPEPPTRVALPEPAQKDRLPVADDALTRTDEPFVRVLEGAPATLVWLRTKVSVPESVATTDDAVPT